MNFTLEKKFNLALIAVAIQLLIWINNNVYFFFSFSYGDFFVTVFRILDAISVLFLLPFFITVVRNRSLIFTPQLTETRKESPPQSTSLIKHIATRLGSIIILFVLAYIIILDGRGDSMGYGLLYAGLATICITVVGLLVDAILIYRKEKDSSRFYTNIFIISALALGGFRVFGGS